MLRASYNLPSSSSTLAAATHPEELSGLALITAYSKTLAFFKSFISVSELILRLFKSVI